MTLARAPQTPDDLRALPAIPDGPVVTITWRPPFGLLKQEIFAVAGVTPDGGAGVEPEHVVKALCRALNCGPGALAFEPDEKARHLSGDDARCYLIDAGGVRIAHIVGLSFAWLRVCASRLSAHDWRPGRNRGPGLHPLTPSYPAGSEPSA